MLERVGRERGYPYSKIDIIGQSALSSIDTTSFIFTVSAPWKLTTSDTKAAVTWFTVDKTSGLAGKHRVSITMEANPSTTTLREGYIKITSGATTQIITVSQSKSNVLVTGVTLNKSETSILAGNKETLVATVLPANATNKSVTWHTSDASIATISTNGEVTAIKPGEVDISVYPNQGSGNAFCKVIVIESVTGITLNKSILSLERGTKETLIATITPAYASNKDIIWSSNAENIAVVSAKGEVTARGEGTATITATSKDNPEKKATCVVTILPTAEAIVGDYYYADGTWSYELNSTKICMGVVFFVNPDGKSGKLVIRENSYLTWDEIQEYAKSKKNGGKTWTCPTRDELQYLYCAYAGVPFITWGDNEVCPDEESNIAQDFFNSRLKVLGGDELKEAYIWSSTTSGSDAWSVHFVLGSNRTWAKNVVMAACVIATF